MAHCHTCQIIPDELWFGILIGVAEDMCNGEGISCDETTTPKEASVDKSGTVFRDPLCDEICVFLVVHLL